MLAKGADTVGIAHLVRKRVSGNPILVERTSSVAEGTLGGVGKFIYSSSSSSSIDH